ncbi:hypothetical protein Tcan_15268 [Toxocara canis]|uniref:Uncharacterized protein n=1 Tax=Toxocara canis TaxID=6265 RepID=A0A0B2VJN1_TOXCA|nr:hypothetical protein Tcan_15268 [Toxocara canis]
MQISEHSSQLEGGGHSVRAHSLMLDIKVLDSLVLIIQLLQQEWEEKLMASGSVDLEGTKPVAPPPIRQVKPTATAATTHVMATPQAIPAGSTVRIAQGGQKHDRKREDNKAVTIGKNKGGTRLYGQFKKLWITDARDRACGGFHGRNFGFIHVPEMMGFSDAVVGVSFKLTIHRCRNVFSINMELDSLEKGIDDILRTT